MLAFAQEQPDNVIAMPQKNNEWFTPAKYVEAAREVMGGIDLDPASCKEANRVVRAEKFYTMKDNGLEQPWYGNIWLNPPYGKCGNATSYQAEFVQKAFREPIEQAILCVIARPHKKWFLPLWEYTICFADHEVMFHRPREANMSHFWGTCFVYLGPHEQRFMEVFSQFGRIAKAIDTPKAHPINLSLWEPS